MLDENTILQGRYQIVRPIGQGGMGTVYLAKDLRLGNPVALKENIFKDDGMLKAFEHEARLLAGLRHSALPKVFDHFAEGDGNFLVMEFIAGNDLNEILEKRRKKLQPVGLPKPFEIDEVMNWAIQLLDALDYLHNRPSPILHRDIKPQNLKLAERNQIILLDFGLAKGALLQATQALPQKSVRGYTPSYAPIEQIQGAGTEPRSDLYSLAATLYHLITGIEPPDALRRANAILGGEQDPLRPAHEVNLQIPQAISSVLAKTLALHCNARPATAKAMMKLVREAQNFDSAQRDDREAGDQTVVSPPFHQTVPVFVHPHVEQQQFNPYSLPRGETVPHPTPGVTDISPTARTQMMPGNRSRVKIWLGIVATLVALAGFTMAAIYIVSNKNKPLPPPVNQNRQVLQPPVKNSNTQNSNLQNVIPVIPDAVKALTSAENFVVIKAGEFLMGPEQQGESNDVPHAVKITRPFEMSKYEITQTQWESLMSGNPSHFKGANLPVENVSWDDAQAFIAKLNEFKDGYTYRLPTEAEWEYSCRAGSKAKYESNLDQFAWYGDNSGLKQLNSEDIWNNNRQNYNKVLVENDCQSHRVGSKKPNAWGLYDMQGNVWEWCQDWYGERYYLDSPDKDPTGPSSGSQRVNRGGSWYSQTERCQTTIRGKDNPENKLFNLGFRLVRTRTATK
jgi:formylglycine-generating enzyme required for sulfatase activity